MKRATRTDDWWLCHACWRAFEAQECWPSCPFCKANTDVVRRYSKCREGRWGRADLPLVPVQGQAYPQYVKAGRFAKWTRYLHVTADGRYKAQIVRVKIEHEQTWQKLRNKILRIYGRRCMRCGRTDGQLYVDHIQSWEEYPERRYDPENLQLLCRDCHTWKHRQVTQWDFRPKGVRSPESRIRILKGLLK